MQSFCISSIAIYFGCLYNEDEYLGQLKPLYFTIGIYKRLAVAYYFNDKCIMYIKSIICTVVCRLLKTRALLL